ncbi:hypothetical protein [Aequorivita xiaoshiensis]|uniref:Sulfotransferase domain-containing protein n=1 Tax=Aequorivita xiaoshiensis TaxID=2874476 RepID=A0A9X1R205_9FLAO|nr:hypothetical protein [Aequorivita xiaoshiensis]MCG2431675.1 hypothetical protein [Aequorivita xiaoshiensis]
MKQVWIHMGYPKCFSTSLQKAFFEKHPEITYGGIGVGDHLSFANSGLEFVFQSLLQHANKPYFERNFIEAKKIVDEFVNSASNTTVFSLETLVFPFSSLDFETITERIKLLFEGYDIHILLVIREQFDFLKSLYGEFLRMGYPETFSNFIQWVWAYRDRNFWELLNYPQVYDFLKQSFGDENIHLQFFENWKSNPEIEINASVSQLLGISNKNLPIWNDNPSLKKEEQANLLYVNQEFRRGMGEHVLFPYLNHLNRTSLVRLESGYSNEEVYENILTKRLALSKMSRIPQQPFEDFYKLRAPSDDILKRMKQEWKITNKQLMDELETVPKTYLS